MIDSAHREIIIQVGYNSGHIANPFSPLFYPHRSEYTTPFHLMCPRINNQKLLDPLWERERERVYREVMAVISTLIESYNCCGRK